MLGEHKKKQITGTHSFPVDPEGTACSSKLSARPGGLGCPAKVNKRLGGEKKETHGRGPRHHAWPYGFARRRGKKTHRANKPIGGGSGGRGGERLNQVFFKLRLAATPAATAAAANKSKAAVTLATCCCFVICPVGRQKCNINQN